MASLVLGLALSLAPAAHAVDQVSAIESVDAVDLVRGTLLLAGTEYHTTPQTGILGVKGERFTLQDLKASDGNPDNYEVHEVEFRASRSGPTADWVLQSITVLGYYVGE